MLLLRGITQCVSEQGLAFLKGSSYWFLLMNYPKCRIGVVAGVQSKSPTLASKYNFKSWHTEPWCSSPSSPFPKGELMGTAVFLPTLHMVSNTSFCRKFPWNQKEPLQSKLCTKLKRSHMELPAAHFIRKATEAMFPLPFHNLVLEAHYVFVFLRHEVKIPRVFPTEWVGGRCALGIAALSSPSSSRS